MSRPQGYLGYFLTSSSVLVASGKNSYLINSLREKPRHTVISSWLTSTDWFSTDPKHGGQVGTVINVPVLYRRTNDVTHQCNSNETKQLPRWRGSQLLSPWRQHDNNVAKTQRQQTLSRQHLKSWVLCYSKFCATHWLMLAMVSIQLRMRTLLRIFGGLLNSCTIAIW